jgi:hypothetical protein
MSRYKVTFEIQALKLHIEGDRDTVHEVTGALQQQMGSLIGAPQALVDGETVQVGEKNVTPTAILTETTKRKPRRGRKPKVDSVEVTALDFQHDSGKWGHPLQEWTVTKKEIWLLFIVEQQGLTTEMSSAQIAATFNKHFRQANPINGGYVTRDLSKEKGNLVNEDTSKESPAWFLTQAGKDYAQTLVAEAKSATESV